MILVRLVILFTTQQQSNARICMLTEVGTSGKLEPTKDAGEAVLEF
jgi:hypothetical protein